MIQNTGILERTLFFAIQLKFGLIKANILTEKLCVMIEVIFMQDYFCVIGATHQSATFPQKACW